MPLYVVATPIGNLRDLTTRAREVLASCAAVIAEDTRHSGQLLKHLGISRPFVSLPAFDEAARAEPILRRLAAGESLALVTDAGTPAVSVSGFAEGRFHFAGFLPRKASHRDAMLLEMRPLRAQLVFYESPQRLGETLLVLREKLGDRPALVARELTKVHEELARGTLGELAQRFSGEVRGEVVIVVSGAPQEEEAEDPAALEEEIRSRLDRGERPKQIAEALAGVRPKRDIYQLALKLKG